MLPLEKKKNLKDTTVDLYQRDLDALKKQLLNWISQRDYKTCEMTGQKGTQKKMTKKEYERNVLHTLKRQNDERNVLHTLKRQNDEMLLYIRQQNHFYYGAFQALEHRIWTLTRQIHENESQKVSGKAPR